MSDTKQTFSTPELNRIFTRFNQQQVEEFYGAYQYWLLQQQLADLKATMDSLHQQILDNLFQLQQTCPSPIALASLAQLQSKGVENLDLLDRMLERGEDWLDLTMERLARCEQLGFIHDNYSEWCQHALEDAYDWIDSMDDATGIAPAAAATSPISAAIPDARRATSNASPEDISFVKQHSDDEEANSEITLKMKAIPRTPPRESEQPLTLPLTPQHTDAAAESVENDQRSQATSAVASHANGERSDAESVGARFIAPLGWGGADPIASSSQLPTVAETPPTLLELDPADHPTVHIEQISLPLDHPVAAPEQQPPLVLRSP